MKNTRHIFSKAKALYNYESYKEMVKHLFASGRVTGDVQNEERKNATAINLQRMKRLDKTLHLEEGLQQRIRSLKSKWHWYLISEGWCGDSAQNLPYIAKMAGCNPNIKLHILLRDENLEIMDRFLTNGGRAIPKLICTDSSSGRLIGAWGPRPEEIARKVKQFKSDHPHATHEEWVHNLHLWYAQNKGQAIQKDFYEKITEWEKLFKSE